MISVGGIPVQLQVWDTAGNSALSTVTSDHYHAANAVMIVWAHRVLIVLGFQRRCVCVPQVFDVTDRNSFDHVPDWLEEAGRYSAGVVVRPLPVCLTRACLFFRFRKGVHRMSHVMLVGNKCDLPLVSRRVSSEEAHVRQCQCVCVCGSVCLRIDVSSAAHDVFPL